MKALALVAIIEVEVKSDGERFERYARAALEISQLESDLDVRIVMVRRCRFQEHVHRRRLGEQQKDEEDPTRLD